ncbi:MAG: DUF938 domain-containing protein [Parvularculaceae bacterium]
MTNKEIALEERTASGARLRSPSAERNRDAIREVFLRLMPGAGAIVEIASGSGQHGAHIAAASPDIYWRPGDPDAASRTSIAAWTAHSGLANVAAPHNADVTRTGWEGDFGAADGVFCANMIHIAPFEAAKGLIAGAGRLLKPGGRLMLYGPFTRNGAHTAPSNEAFDASLKARDPRWGVRDLDRDIAPLAIAAGLSLVEIVDMPSNNFSVIFEKG